MNTSRYTLCQMNIHLEVYTSREVYTSCCSLVWIYQSEKCQINKNLRMQNYSKTNFQDIICYAKKKAGMGWLCISNLHSRTEWSWMIYHVINYREAAVFVLYFTVPVHMVAIYSETQCNILDLLNEMVLLSIFIK